MPNPSQRKQSNLDIIWSRSLPVHKHAQSVRAEASNMHGEPQLVLSIERQKSSKKISRSNIADEKKRHTQLIEPVVDAIRRLKRTGVRTDIYGPPKSELTDIY